MNILPYFLFFLGFLFLIKGADWLIDSAVAFAAKLKVPEIIIGLTIVAFGTSLPEFVVNVMATLRGAGDLALGNVLGSNIANTLLILGIAATMSPIIIPKNTVWKEIPLSILASFVLLALASDYFLEGGIASVLSRIDGIVLLSFFSVFLSYIVYASVNARELIKDVEEREEKGAALLLPKFIGGLIGLIFGGKWIVEGSIFIAQTMGVSESIIGLTIVAIGTSLPELATSLVAMRKRKHDIAVGNIIGSNIFNIFWVLGICAVMNPLSISSHSLLNMSLVLIAQLFLFIGIFLFKKKKKEYILQKWKGWVLLTGYAVYILSMIYIEIFRAL